MTDTDHIITELLPLARSASANAYSPYSKVKVGAVVVGSDGELFTGCNVENGSYGLTQCAERNALCAAMAAGQQAGEMKALLVYSDGFKSLSPCGACRQVMSELLSNDAVIISCSDGEEPHYWIMGQLLPEPFVLK